MQLPRALALATAWLSVASGLFTTSGCLLLASFNDDVASGGAGGAGAGGIGATATGSGAGGEGAGAVTVAWLSDADGLVDVLEEVGEAELARLKLRVRSRGDAVVFQAITPPDPAMPVGSGAISIAWAGVDGAGLAFKGSGARSTLTGRPFALVNGDAAYAGTWNNLLICSQGGCFNQEETSPDTAGMSEVAWPESLSGPVGLEPNSSVLHVRTSAVGPDEEKVEAPPGVGGNKDLPHGPLGSLRVLPPWKGTVGKESRFSFYAEAGVGSVTPNTNRQGWYVGSLSEDQVENGHLPATWRFYRLPPVATPQESPCIVSDSLSLDADAPSWVCADGSNLAVFTPGDIGSPISETDTWELSSTAVINVGDTIRWVSTVHDAEGAPVGVAIVRIVDAEHAFLEMCSSDGLADSAMDCVSSGVDFKSIDHITPYINENGDRIGVFGIGRLQSHGPGAYGFLATWPALPK